MHRLFLPIHGLVIICNNFFYNLFNIDAHMNEKVKDGIFGTTEMNIF